MSSNSRKSMNYQPLTIKHLILIAFLIPLISLSSTPTVSGTEDEQKFLNALKERGYNRLVEIYCHELLENASVTPKQKAMANKELAKIALQSAKNTKSTKERIKFLEEASKRLNSLEPELHENNSKTLRPQTFHSFLTRTFDLGTSFQEIGLAILNQLKQISNYEESDKGSPGKTNPPVITGRETRSQLQNGARNAFNKAASCFKLVLKEIAKNSPGTQQSGTSEKDEIVKEWIKRIRDNKIKFVYHIKTRRQGRPIARRRDDYVTVYFLGKPRRKPVTLRYYDDFLEFNPFAIEARKRRASHVQRTKHPPKNEPSVEEIAMRSEYELASTYYYNAQIYTKPKKPLFAVSPDDFALDNGQALEQEPSTQPEREKERLLKKAIVAFGSFIWKYEKRLLSIDAYLGKAICYRELGKYDKAMDIFDMIVESNLPRQTKPSEIGILYTKRASYEKAVTLVQSGKYQEAVKSAENAINLPYNTNAENAKEIEQWDNKARLVKIESLLLVSKELLAKGDANESQQRRKEAASTAYDLIKLGGYWQTEACRLVADYCSTLPKGEELSTFERFALADMLFNRRQYGKALSLYGEVASNSVGKDNTEIIAESNFKIGLSNFEIGEYKKAADVFAAVSSKYPRTSLAKDAAYYSTMCYGKYYDKTGKIEDYKAYINSLRNFIAKFPDYRRTDDAQWSLAIAIEQNPQAHTQFGNFENAAKEFRKISPHSKHYPEARLAAARCLEKEVRQREEQGQSPEQTAQLFERTLKELTNVASWAREQARIDRSQRARFTKLASDAEFRIARLYLDMKQSDKAMELLKSFDKRYADQRDLMFKSLYIRLSADLQQGKLGDAELKLQEMLKKYPNLNQKNAAILQLASAFAKDAEKLYKMGNKPEADAYLQKSIYIYEVRLKYLKEQTKEEKDAAARIRFKIAEGYARLERWLDALPYYEELNKSNPNAVDVLERLAICYEKTGKNEKALEAWRKLSQLLRPPSRKWFESKYHLVLMHYRLGNIEDARKILDVTRTLHPELGGPELREKFIKLERKYK